MSVTMGKEIGELETFVRRLSYDDVYSRFERDVKVQNSTDTKILVKFLIIFDVGLTRQVRGLIKKSISDLKTAAKSSIRKPTFSRVARILCDRNSISAKCRRKYL